VSFLAYIINEDTSGVLHRLTEDGAQLHPDKEGVLNGLVVMENQLQQLSAAQRKFERNARLSQYKNDLGGTVAAYFRKTCGGSENPPTTHNEVERLLLHFVEQTYPLRLNNDKELGAFSSVYTSWQDPAREELQVAVMADDVLAKLYPDDSKHGGPSGSAIRSTGQGGGVQLWGLAENILGSAWHYAHFGREHPTFDEFAHAVLVMVRTLRKALQGKKAEVPMRVGLAGVLLPEGVDAVDFGWARVRRADQRDVYFTRRISVEGQLQHTNAEGETIVIDYAGNLVLELDIPYKVLLKELDMTAPWPDELNHTSMITEPIECLRLGLLLAGISENSAAATTWQSVVDPLHGFESIGWNDPRRGTNLLPVQLADEQVDLWKEWVVKIHDHRTPQTSVSIRRILRAVSEQKEPEDTLIDAVIVWENFFGDVQETTLRVTTSVAWMLGSGAASRKDLVKEAKNIYKQRSNIVHGNAKVDVKKTPQYATRAIELSIQLLRTMFTDHTDLLQLKTGGERSGLILLDALDESAD
jgi:Apea-like HEPN